MDFSLTDEQWQIKQLVKQFCKRELDFKRIKELDEKTTQARTVEELKAAFPYDIYQKVFDVGLRQILIPLKYGGTAPEKDVNQTMAIVNEEAGYWGGAAFLMTPIGAFTSTANTYITEEQKKWLFSQLLTNPRFMVGQTVSEPAGATDIHLPYDDGGSSILQVTAHKDGNEWVLNGSKMYGSLIGVADYLMVAARTDKNASVSQAMTYFWVPADSPGLSIIPNRMTAMGFGGNCQSFYDDVRIPESNIIGQVNKGFNVLSAFFESMYIGVAASVGGMRKLYEDMREYSKQRVVGGKPLIKHSSTAAKLGELAINVEALRNYVYRAAWECDQLEKRADRKQRDFNFFWAQSAVVFGKQVAWKFCEMAIDIYGGMSGSIDFPVEGFLRHSFVARAAGLTPNAALMRTCWDYDDRYRVE